MERNWSHSPKAMRRARRSRLRRVRGKGRVFIVRCSRCGAMLPATPTAFFVSGGFCRHPVMGLGEFARQGAAGEFGDALRREIGFPGDVYDFGFVNDAQLPPPPNCDGIPANVLGKGVQASRKARCDFVRIHSTQVKKNATPANKDGGGANKKPPGANKTLGGFGSGSG